MTETSNRAGGEVSADCPQCSESIPFFATVDGENAPGDSPPQCPECGTATDVLFDIAQGPIGVGGDESSDLTQQLATDGGVGE